MAVCGEYAGEIMRQNNDLKRKLDAANARIEALEAPLPESDECPHCEGFGLKLDNHDEDCPHCFGAGDLGVALEILITQCASSSMTNDDPLVLAAKRILINGDHLAA